MNLLWLSIFQNSSTMYAIRLKGTIDDRLDCDVVANMESER